MKKGIVILLFVAVVIGSFGSYFLIKQDFERVKEVKNIEQNYDADFEYEIEEISYSDKDVIIRGWIAEINNINRYINRNILLKDESGNIIAIKTEAEERKDLEVRNTDKTNYSKCGLIGRVNKDKLTKGEKYQVGFMIVSQDKKKNIIFTDKIIEIS